MEEASSAGHVLLRRMIKLHYNEVHLHSPHCGRGVGALPRQAWPGRCTPPPAPAAMPAPDGALARGRG
eukprot:7390349-Prymnesium_polylepis.1